MKKAISRIMIITILLSLSLVGNVFAGYEASSVTNPKVNATADTFFENIRKMEAEGGTLGLKAKINQTTFLEEDGSNGLDCHMIKNTEWGPIAMLTASQYGTTLTSESASSTGNNTGVYHLYGLGGGSKKAPNCYVAGILKDGSATYIQKLIAANDRYRDEYTSNTGITGDATTETNKWYSGHTFFVRSTYPMFTRGYDSVFGYCAYDTAMHAAFGSRAVVVCGDGL